MSRTEIRRGDFLESQVADIDAFLSQLEAENKAEDTIRSYRWSLERLANAIHKPFREITKDEIIKFVNSIETKSTKALVKTHVKKLYQWLYGLEKGQYPKKVGWITVKPSDMVNDITKDKLLTDEELKRVIQKAGSSRDRAIIAVLWETAARASEILSLKIGSVEATDYGFVLYIQESKTEVRNLPIIQTATYLARWLEDHPYKDNKEAPLWIGFKKNYYGKRLGYSGLYIIFKQAKKRAGIKKKLTPKWLRHMRLTELATDITEQSLKNFAGWSRDSHMPKVYIHLNGKDTVDAILKASGLKPEEKKEPIFEPIECPRCKTVNSDTAVYCSKCGSPLTLKMALATQPSQTEDMKRLKDELNQLRQLITNSGKIPLDFLAEAYQQYQDGQMQEDLEAEQDKLTAETER